MELNVTYMVKDADEMPMLSGSRAELGDDAGRLTWNNSVKYALEHPLLLDDDMRDAARAHFRSYGAWSEDEIAAWSEEALQGIVCQEVASAIREMESAEDYEDYERGCERGTYSGRLYRGDEGQWYCYFGD